MSDISQYGSDEEDDATGRNVGSEAVKHAYRDKTWSHKCFTYDPKPRAFVGRRDTKRFFERIPTIWQLFELFWPFNLLRKIVIETNRYATEPLDARGNTRGGKKWKALTVAGLKAFMAIHMYMGMKKQPNYKTYWEKVGTFFHCPIIANIMTRERFIELRRCLHITDPGTYEHIPKGDPRYDKLRQVRWFVEEIRKACMREWSLGKFLTIDKMMVRYKGSYCPIRQYMPKKPEKWGIKIWVLADSASKFIYFFEIYCGKNLEAEIRMEGTCADGGSAYGVVMNLLSGLEERGHCVVMDNYFCSIPLFEDLVKKGIYAIGTVRSNRIGLPSHLKNTRTWKKCDQGHIEWAMHDSRDLNYVMWKDKCPVLLISTHANPIGFPYVPRDEVPHWNGPVREKIPTSPMLLEYTTYMRGVDVADQLRASYSSQSRSHKWWHRVFFALLDISEVNSYIMYLDRCKQGPNPMTIPMTHLQFKNALCEALLVGWLRRTETRNESLTHHPSIHMPSHSTKKRLYIVCEVRTPRTYCYQCDFKFICWKEGCYQRYHEALSSR
jgi:hypothetical protein